MQEDGDGVNPRDADVVGVTDGVTDGGTEGVACVPDGVSFVAEGLMDVVVVAVPVPEGTDGSTGDNVKPESEGLLVAVLLYDWYISGVQSSIEYSALGSMDSSMLCSTSGVMTSKFSVMDASIVSTTSVNTVSVGSTISSSSSSVPDVSTEGDVPASSAGSTMCDFRAASDDSAVCDSHASADGIMMSDGSAVVVPSGESVVVYSYGVGDQKNAPLLIGDADGEEEGLLDLIVNPNGDLDDVTMPFIDMDGNRSQDSCASDASAS